MTVRGYVLVEAEVGKAKSVGEQLKKLHANGSKATSVDTTTGPFDLIVQLEGEDLDKFGNYVTDHIQKTDGVQRTTTCLAVHLGG
jgi:DNA-binding Lrp family transcriptional regulator